MSSIVEEKKDALIVSFARILLCNFSMCSFCSNIEEKSLEVVQIFFVSNLIIDLFIVLLVLLFVCPFSQKMCAKNASKLSYIITYKR